MQGRDDDGAILEEMTTCEDASAGGVSLRLARPVRQGQVLHLSLPLPSRFRQFDLTAASYRVYGLVRAVIPEAGAAHRVGVLFYGRNPPQGAESLPSGLFLIEGDPRPVRNDSGIPISLRLPASQAPGGQEQEERTVIEKVTARVVRVKVTSLPVMRGMLLRVAEPGVDFESGAEVEQILIGTDGSPRVDLALDADPPPSWNPSQP